VLYTGVIINCLSTVKNIKRSETSLCR